MKNEPASRRSFLKRAALSATILAWPRRRLLAGAAGPDLRVGEGVVDTTPPLGIEMAGFHRAAGHERRIAGIRGATAARALVLQMGDTRMAVVSVDITAVSGAMTTRVQQRVARQVGIPAANVRLCATHTHSMPAFCYLRQWGAISPEYMATVETAIVRAVELAQADLAPATLRVGNETAPGASNNRTTKTWKTDQQFTGESTDDERWLDTTVHVLHFERDAGQRDLLWYHFSAHPVCYQDDQAGPDWPGMVAELVQQSHGMAPSFLQGHCGDVNAGDASHWIGSAENTAQPVAAAIGRALDKARRVTIDKLRVHTQQIALPLDMTLFRQWLEEYQRDPAQCNTGPWVDAGFAEDWYRHSVQRDLSQTELSMPLSAAQLGDVGLVFHPAELYSCYGLMIRRDSPLPDTLVVGYADDIAGYLPDPNAYKAGEYSATTVPKILDLPPFRPNAGRVLTASATASLKKLVA